MGLGYRSSCGRKVSNTFNKSAPYASFSRLVHARNFGCDAEAKGSLALTKHGRPCLVDDVQAHRASSAAVGATVRTPRVNAAPSSSVGKAQEQIWKRKAVRFIHIGVVDLVHKAYGGRLVGVCFRQFHMDFPEAALVWTCSVKRVKVELARGSTSKCSKDTALASSACLV